MRGAKSRSAKHPTDSTTAATGVKALETTAHRRAVTNIALSPPRENSPAPLTNAYISPPHGDDVRTQPARRTVRCPPSFVSCQP